jgi:hypothetical protein
MISAVYADTKEEDYGAQIEQTDFKVNDEKGYKVKFLN